MKQFYVYLIDTLLHILQMVMWTWIVEHLMVGQIFTVFCDRLPRVTVRLVVQKHSL